MSMDAWLLLSIVGVAGAVAIVFSVLVVRIYDLEEKLKVANGRIDELTANQFPVSEKLDILAAEMGKTWRLGSGVHKASFL